MVDYCWKVSPRSLISCCLRNSLCLIVCFVVVSTKNSCTDVSYFQDLANMSANKEQIKCCCMKIQKIQKWKAIKFVTDKRCETNMSGYRTNALGKRRQYPTIDLIASLSCYWQWSWVEYTWCDKLICSIIVWVTHTSNQNSLRFPLYPEHPDCR